MAQSKRMDPYLQDSQSSFALFARGSDNPSSNSNGVVKESELSALLKKLSELPNNIIGQALLRMEAKCCFISEFISIFFLNINPSP